MFSNFFGFDISSLAKSSYDGYLLDDYYKSTSLRKVQSVEGSSMLVPIEIIKKHGFMREDFFMYGEETDYCYTLKKQGISSYIVIKSVVVHKGAESFKNSKHLELYYRRRNILYFEKDHYGKTILKNLQERLGIFNLIKFFIKHKVFTNQKEELYYLNLACIHALYGKKGSIS